MRLGEQRRGFSSRGRLLEKALAALNRRRAVQRAWERDPEHSTAVGPSGDRVPGTELEASGDKSVVQPSTGPASSVAVSPEVTTFKEIGDWTCTYHI